MADSSFMQGDRDNSIAVPFSDDEAANNQGADLDEDDSPTASPEEQLTRRQRRQERLNGLLREGKQSKEELSALRDKQSKLETELAQLRGYVAAQPVQRPANDDGKNPYERRLDAVYARQSEAYNSAQAHIKAGTFTDELQRHYEQIAREIESEKTRIHTEEVVDRKAHSMRGEQAQQVWVQKYPDVYNNPNAFNYAQGRFQQRKALGEAVTNDLVDEIMNETLATFKLGKKSAPSAGERARMTGLPSAGSGSGGRATGIVMNPAFKRMAHAAHPDLSEAEAEKKWVNGPGRKLRDKKIL